MCGIVGYVGKKRVVPVIIEGLRRLEYRGYDSAGIAVAGNGDGLRFAAPRENCATWKMSSGRSRLRNLRHWPHALGDPRPSHGRKRPSASRLHRPDRRGAQRHRRKLRS